MGDVRFTTQLAADLQGALERLEALETKVAGQLTPEHISALETTVNGKIAAVETTVNAGLATIETKVNAAVAAAVPTPVVATTEGHQ